MAFWDGYRWQPLPTAAPQPRAPEPRPHRGRDLLATAVILVGLLALILPTSSSQAAMPGLELSPNVAMSGSRVRVTAEDLPAQTRIRIWMDGGTRLASARVSNRGTLRTSFTVPDTDPGAHALAATATVASNARGSAADGNGTVLAIATLTVMDPPGATPEAIVSDTPGATPLVTPGATPDGTANPTAAPTLFATPAPTAVATQAATPVPTQAVTPAPTPIPPPKSANGAPAIPTDGKVLFNAATGTLGALRPETYPNDHPGDGMIRCGLFTADPTYFPISGGALHLRAQKVGGSWVQTFLTTRTTYTQKYGVFRAALQWDNGYQLWPSFWLYDPNWSSAEIDAVENHPNPDNPNDWGFHLHPGTYDKGLQAPADHVNTWHVYEVEWRPTFVAVRLDGVEKARFTSGSPSVPMWAGFDMKLGTPWLNQCPDSTTPTTAELRVAWLQVAP